MILILSRTALLIIFYISYCQSLPIYAQNKSYEIQTVAFYNMENLFDTINDPLTWDDDWTPNGKHRWDSWTYSKKLESMTSAILEIGRSKNPHPPALIGLCEIENSRVLNDMINHPNLIEFDYDYVHFDSPDRRGIDVALIYRRGHFTPTNSTSNRLLLFEDDLVRKSRIYTRDQLVVSGELGGERIHLVINHWPSRRGGKKSSHRRRLAAARLTRRLCDSIFTVDRYAQIIVMGDFNDDPSDLSIQYLMGKADGSSRSDELVLSNPMSELFRKGYGTLAYRDGWNLFDQMLLSPYLIKGEASRWKFFKVGIQNHSDLIQKKGKYRGYPRRGMQNDLYTGGFSDHFPVYVYLVRFAR